MTARSKGEAKLKALALYIISCVQGGSAVWLLRGSVGRRFRPVGWRESRRKMAARARENRQHGSRPVLAGLRGSVGRVFRPKICFAGARAAGQSVGGTEFENAHNGFREPVARHADFTSNFASPHPAATNLVSLVAACSLSLAMSFLLSRATWAYETLQQLCAG